MKTTKAILSLFIILTSFGLSKLNAQENLWRWVEKYEKDTSVDVTIITITNNKKVDKEVYSIVVADSPNAVNELIDAYNKDKQNANSHTERRSKGKNDSFYCVFKNKDINETFSLSFNRTNGVTLSIVKSYSTNGGLDFHSFYFNPHTPHIVNDSYIQSMRAINQSFHNIFSDSSFVKAIQAIPQDITFDSNSIK